MTDGLKVTGERVVEGRSSRTEWLSHRSRYRFAGQFARGKEVLDLACGSGYGSHVLVLAGASRVTGVDISTEAVEYASQRYQHPGLRFVVGDGMERLFEDNSFDTITSFETIEHVPSPDSLLSALTHYLRPDGALLISTPNLDALFGARASFSPYHVCEFHFAEFDKLLSAYFSEIDYYWQPWPIELASARRFVYSRMERGRESLSRRIIPPMARRMLNRVASSVMSLAATESRLGPQPWSRLRNLEDACLVVAVATNPLLEGNHTRLREAMHLQYAG